MTKPTASAPPIEPSVLSAYAKPMPEPTPRSDCTTLRATSGKVAPKRSVVAKSVTVASVKISAITRGHEVSPPIAPAAAGTSHSNCP